DRSHPRGAASDASTRFASVIGEAFSYAQQLRGDGDGLQGITQIVAHDADAALAELGFALELGACGSIHLDGDGRHRLVNHRVNELRFASVDRDALTPTELDEHSAKVRELAQSGRERVVLIETAARVCNGNPAAPERAPRELASLA